MPSVGKFAAVLAMGMVLSVPTMADETPLSPMEQQQMADADTKVRLGRSLIAEAQLMAQVIQLQRQIAALKVKCGDACADPPPAK